MRGKPGAILCLLWTSPKLILSKLSCLKGRVRGTLCTIVRRLLPHRY